MDPKVVFLVVSLMTLAITSTNALMPKCCIITRDISFRKLLNAERWEFQSSAAVCQIDALLVYLRGQKRPMCAHPKYKKLVEKLKLKRGTTTSL